MFNGRYPRQWAFALLVAICCSFSQAADRDVRIGFSGPLSGLSEISGSSMLHGAELAIEDINKRGVQLNGERLVFSLLPQNDKSTAWMGRNAANYFVKAGAVGVVGLFNSAVSIAVSDIYDNAGIPHFAVSGARRFTQQGYASAFRITAYDDQRATSLARYAIKDMGWKRIAIVHDDSPFGTNYDEKFTAAVKALGGVIVSSRAVSSNTFDFNGVLNQIKLEAPQAIFFGGLTAQTAAFAKSTKRLGVTVPTLAAASVTGDAFLANAEGGGEGLISIRPGVGSRDRKRLDAFEKRYRERFAIPMQAYAPFAYDSVELLVAAIKSANSLVPTDITAALHRIRYEGMTGSMAFDASGDLREISFDLYQIRNGRWEALKQISMSGMAIRD